ncbi:MAG: ATP-binding protein, partial [bacterium]
IVGTIFRPRNQKVGNEELENWLSHHLDPPIDFDIFEKDIEGKHLVIISVDAARDRPVKFKNNEYIRIGSYKKKLADHPEKERKIWSKGSSYSFENAIALEGLYDNEILDYLDWNKYYQLQNQNYPTNFEVILDQLLQDDLLVQEGNKYNITNLGAILFAKDLKKFRRLERKAIRVIIYNGKNRTRTKHEQIGKFGYASGFEGLIQYINDKLPTNEEIGIALRSNIKVYPEIAIRELVANALIHQNFEIKGAGPMIEIFDDRVEISNPGKPLIQPLRFIDHTPKSRNEKLASTMRRFSICEERGSGIDKVIYAIELYQLPAPLFEEESEYVKVTLYLPIPFNKMKKIDRIRACYQHCVLKYVSNDEMSNSSLRKRLKINKSNYPIASRIISDTISEKLIKEKDPSNKSPKFTRYIPFWA